MSIKTIRAVAIAAVVGVILYLVAKTFLQTSTGLPLGPTMSVWKTSQPIAIGQTINPATLSRVDVAKGSIVDPFTGDIAKLYGFPASVPIAASGIISRDNFVTAGANENMAYYTIASTYLSMPVTALAPGTYVDVTVTYHGPASSSRSSQYIAAVGGGFHSVTIETKVPVIAFSASPQDALTIGIPRSDVRALDVLKRLDATFSFAQVLPGAPSTYSGSASNDRDALFRSLLQ